MDKDYSELVKYLDKRFTNVDSKFNKTDDRFNKIDDRFDKIDNRFDKIEKELETKADKKDVQNLINSIDKLVKAIEIYHHEQVALSSKVDRHEKWIIQIAQQIGIELKP